MSILSTVGAIAAILAGLLHVFIFYMESIAWTSEKARSTFGMTKEEAIIPKKWPLIRDSTTLCLL
nr:DUF1304 family protein [Lancefieldella parvula]